VSRIKTIHDYPVDQIERIDILGSAHVENVRLTYKNKDQIIREEYNLTDFYKIPY
jgi:hypothetical protein